MMGKKIKCKKCSHLNGIIANLKKEIDGFWWMLDRCFSVESREEFNRRARLYHGPDENAMMVAVHAIWKRDPRVEGLEAENTTLKAVPEKVRGWQQKFLDSCESGPIIHDGGNAALNEILSAVPKPPAKDETTDKQFLKPCPFCGKKPTQIDANRTWCINNDCPIHNIPFERKTWNLRRWNGGANDIF